ncbi:MAG: methyltransferase domain-containing protein [Chloroflexales bacterium]
MSEPPSGKTSSLYRHSGRVPLASRLSYAVRQQMFARFLEVTHPTPTSSVLDVGVTSDERHQESNFFERLYPYKERIVCVGTEDGAHLEQQYPGIRFMPVQPGQPIPFADQEFDIVFSNAVIEHVGGPELQRAFLAELCRVGRHVFVTTPNRWFPVEHHTGIPLLHFLPRPLFRMILRRTAMSYWSHQQNLHILGRNDLAELFPPTAHIRVERIGIGFGPFKSNLLAYTLTPAMGANG